MSNVIDFPQDKVRVDKFVTDISLLLLALDGRIEQSPRDFLNKFVVDLETGKDVAYPDALQLLGYDLIRLGKDLHRIEAMESEAQV